MTNDNNNTAGVPIVPDDHVLLGKIKNRQGEATAQQPFGLWSDSRYTLWIPHESGWRSVSAMDARAFDWCRKSDIVYLSAYLAGFNFDYKIDLEGSTTITVEGNNLPGHCVGEVSSVNLRTNGSDDLYNAAIDGLESLLLAMAYEGMDLESEPVRGAVNSAVLHIVNSAPLDEELDDLMTLIDLYVSRMDDSIRDAYRLDATSQVHFDTCAREGKSWEEALSSYAALMLKDRNKAILNFMDRESEERRLPYNELRSALESSVNLQSHYAEQINAYDGGKRMSFESAEEWVERLREVAKQTSSDDK